MKRFPIVILPGWMLGATRYEPLKKEFLANGFSCLVVDFPGFEQGEKIIHPWDLSDYVSFLKDFLKKLKVSKAIFVCHSFGGRVGLKLLSETPDLAVALILSGTPGFRSINTNKLFAIATLSKVGKSITSLPPFTLFHDIAQKIFNVAVGARDISQLKGFMRQTFINIVEEDLGPYMKRITLPTLLLWGKSDQLVSVEIAEKMSNIIIRSKLVIIPEVKHNFLILQPEIFVSEVIEFLKSI